MSGRAPSSQSKALRGEAVEQKKVTNARFEDERMGRYYSSEEGIARTGAGKD